MDQLDFTNKYNTKLTPEEEIIFQREWVDKLGDLYDYDARGAWKAYRDGRIDFDERCHLTDEFKKPNHPTFSDESIYHGIDGHIGGKWFDNGNGLAAFFAPLNHLYDRNDLYRYFNDADAAEQGVQLIDLRDILYR